MFGVDPDRRRLSLELRPGKGLLAPADDPLGGCRTAAAWLRDALEDLDLVTVRA